MKRRKCTTWLGEVAVYRWLTTNDAMTNVFVQFKGVVGKPKAGGLPVGLLKGHSPMSIDVPWVLFIS